MLAKLMNKQTRFTQLVQNNRRSMMYSNGQDYDKRWQRTFNYAFFYDSEENFPKGKPKPEDTLVYETYFASFKAHFNRRFSNWLTIPYHRRHRIYNDFDLFVLPLSALFFFQFWHISAGFKALGLIPTVSFFMRLKDKTMEPELPETYLRDMIHKNEQLKKYFSVETMQTMDYHFEYMDGFPDENEFPEFKNKLFSLLNRVL